METRTRAIAVLGAVTIALAAAVPASAAGDEPGADDGVEQCIEISFGDQAWVDEGFEFPEGLDSGFPMPSIDADAVAELNGHADDLAAFLDERGIEFETYDVSVVGWDPEDPAAAEAVGEFYAENGLPIPSGWMHPFPMGGIEFLPFGEGLPFGGGFDLGSLPPELEGLFGEGFSFDGDIDLENLPPELKELFGAGLELVGSLEEGFDLENLLPDLEELFGEGFDLEGLPLEFGEVFVGGGEAGFAHTFDEGIPEEFLADQQAEADAIAAALDAAGIGYEIETGPFGGSHVIWDLTDEAANAVVAGVYSDLYGGDVVFKVGPCANGAFGDFDGGWFIEDISGTGDVIVAPDAPPGVVHSGRPDGAFPGPFGPGTELGQISENLTEGRTG